MQKFEFVTLWELVNHLEYRSACESGSACVLVCGGKAGVSQFLLRKRSFSYHVGATVIR